MAHATEELSGQLPRFQAPTIPTAEHWLTFRPLITHLYLEEGKTLKDLRSMLLNQYNFKVTDRMLKSRFHRWAVAKYITKKDSLVALERFSAYKREHGFSPDTVVVRGRTISAEKVVKHLKRRSGCVRSLGVLSGSEKSSAPINAGPEINESSPRSQDRYGEPWPGEEPAEIETEGDEEVSVTNGGSRLTSISASVRQSPSPQQMLKSEELSTLYIAMLQTDYHLRDQELDEHTEDQSNGRKQPDQCRGSPRLSAYTFASPPGMRNLEVALHQTNNYYDALADRQQRNSWTLSSRQQTQARDFYARYWVGLGLIDKRKFETAFKLVNRANDQVRTIVQENHPHFLPWMCFVVCYPFQSSRHGERLQEVTSKFFFSVSTIILQPNHPLVQIQGGIWHSEYRRDICLALLRRVIEIFRHQTQDSHLQEVQLLAKLFDEVDKIDEGNVEVMLAQWAASSLSVAEIIMEDRRKQTERKKEAGSHRM